MRAGTSRQQRGPSTLARVFPEGSPLVVGKSMGRATRVRTGACARMNEPKSTILEFINHELLGDSSGTIELDTPLFNDGLIDSLKILQLIAFIEVTTGRTIPDREVVMENFRTVRNISQRFFHAHPVAIE